MSLKNVMDKESRKIIQIDSTKEKNWTSKYLHRSGIPFEWEQIEVVEPIKELSLELLQDQYEREIGKLPARYKNDKEWIQSKLS